MAPRTPEQNEEIREQTRRQIKDAAFQLFAQEGFTDTPVSSIAEAAGVSKGLIYHYFSSKEDILIGIFEDLQQLGEQMMDFSEDQSPTERMQQMLERTFYYMEQSSEVIRLMISLALQPDAVERLHPHIQKENERQVKVLSGILEQMGYEDPEQEAYYLAAKLDGIALGYISMGDDYPYQQIKQKILKEYVLDKKHS